MNPGQWDELRNVAQKFRQNLVSGDAQPALIRVIQMELIVIGAPQASKIGEQIATMEKRPIREDKDPAISRFLPMADDILKAIGEDKAADVTLFLGQLKSNIGAERLVHSRQVMAKMPQDAKDRAILDLQSNLEDALFKNDTARAVAFATQMQAMISELVSKHQFVNEYAFNHYMVNDALGRAAFLRGDYQRASDYLQKAAEIPPGINGIVRLDDFGPNLWLAEQLVRVGKYDVVVKFLQACKEGIWRNENDKADPWIAALQNGKPSDLTPNSDAGYGYLEQ